MVQVELQVQAEQMVLVALQVQVVQAVLQEQVIDTEPTQQVQSIYLL
jgi:hypothetical protein